MKSIRDNDDRQIRGCERHSILTSPEQMIRLQSNRQTKRHARDLFCCFHLMRI